MAGDDDLPPFYDDSDDGFEEKKPGAKKGHDDPGVPEGSSLDRSLACEPCNDLGNARRFVRRFGDDFLFVERVGWFHWDGSRWNLEQGRSTSFKAAQRVGELIKRERDAFKASPGSLPKDAANAYAGKLKDWQEDSGQTHAVRSMLASAEPHLLRRIAELDSDPYLCPCPNGTIVLPRHREMNATFRPSSRLDLNTRRLGVEYDRNAACPLFERFLRQIILEQDVRDFVQRLFGYCLSGLTREQVLFLFHGSGSNGKSTLMNVIRAVFGDFAAISPVATFLAKREGNSGSEASPDMARLVGARLVSASEPQENAKLDEGRVKEITGGEPITTRHLNKDFFEYRPVFKVIILVNNLPTIYGVDHGIWRRILVVPYTVQISDDRIERDLDTRLIAEGPGILRWLVQGFEAYNDHGLVPPHEAVVAVEQYRADQDSVGEFIAECCGVDKKGVDPNTASHETSKYLRDAFKIWCEENAVDAVKARTFGMKLAGRGFERFKTNGVKAYRGIVLKLSWRNRVDDERERVERERNRSSMFGGDKKPPDKRSSGDADKSGED